MLDLKGALHRGLNEMASGRSHNAGAHAQAMNVVIAEMGGCSSACSGIGSGGCPSTSPSSPPPSSGASGSSGSNASAPLSLVHCPGHLRRGLSIRLEDSMERVARRHHVAGGLGCSVQILNKG